MIRRPPRSTQSRSSAASDVYKRQGRDPAPQPERLSTGPKQPGPLLQSPGSGPPGRQRAAAVVGRAGGRSATPTTAGRDVVANDDRLGGATVGAGGGLSPIADDPRHRTDHRPLLVAVGRDLSRCQPAGTDGIGRSGSTGETIRYFTPSAEADQQERACLLS